jgi:hypothetical protein
MNPLQKNKVDVKVCAFNLCPSGNVPSARILPELATPPFARPIATHLTLHYHGLRDLDGIRSGLVVLESHFP